MRLLLFHAVNDCGLRETTAQAREAGISDMSYVALLKRLRTSADWLSWICSGLCEELREGLRLPESMRVRAVDSTTVQGPASKGTDWRVHYSLDLKTLTCDWLELTDAHGGELLERTPMQKGDVMLTDRGYCRPRDLRAAVKAEAHVVTRLRWKHAGMLDSNEQKFGALAHARTLKVGEIGEWEVTLNDPDGEPITGRVIITKLPAPIAAKAERKKAKKYKKKGKKLDARTLEAAHYVMLFTTLPKELLAAEDVLELYRFRWQIELAFKRLKQLLNLGQVPHKDPRAAKTWILAKLAISLLLETLYRNASAFFPWGFSFRALAPQPA